MCIVAGYQRRNRRQERGLINLVGAIIVANDLLTFNDSRRRIGIRKERIEDRIECTC